jgi:GNAT superfamily N-acetyltransferase
MIPRIASADEEIARCYPAMSSLRPHIKDSEFVPLVREMESEGYRLAYIESAGEVVAVAGYRISTNLHLGKNLYVDDLATLPGSRSRGHGAALLDWLRKQAEGADCDALHLDSGVQRDRAHRFYFRHGFTISAYHFLFNKDAA